MENGELFLMILQTVLMLALFVGNLDMTFDVSLLEVCMGSAILRPWKNCKF